MGVRRLKSPYQEIQGGVNPKFSILKSLQLGHKLLDFAKIYYRVSSHHSRYTTNV